MLLVVLRELGGLLVVCDLLVVDPFPGAPVLVLSMIERPGDVDRDGQVRVIRLGGGRPVGPRALFGRGVLFLLRIDYLDSAG